MKWGNVFIGTSGWHYKHWKGTFYPGDIKDSEQLSYFIQKFKTVELNNSFYRLPAIETFRNWYQATPHDFIFSVKGSRYISHLKKLILDKQAVDEFLDHVAHLKEKLGPILFQLPPRWEVNVERLSTFVSYLPKNQRFTFEFRNPTWYTEDIYQVLRQHHCAFCIYELAGHQSPEMVTADFIYIRLHGPGNKYQGNYTDKSLKNWAKECKCWQREGKDVYVYFDNDQAGYAAFNAQRLIELLNQ